MLYVGLCATLALPVWSVLARTGAPHRSWVAVVPLVAAHLVLGAGTRRVAALAAPVGLAALVLALVARDALTITLTIYAIPFGVGLVAIGLVVPRRAIPVLVSVALVAVGYATQQTVSFAAAPYLSAAEARFLPLQQCTLNSLCGHFGYPAHERGRLERQLLALGRVTRHAPDVKVHTTFDPADEPGTGHEDLRVREL